LGNKVVVTYKKGRHPCPGVFYWELKDLGYELPKDDFWASNMKTPCLIIKITAPNLQKLLEDCKDVASKNNHWPIIETIEIE